MKRIFHLPLFLLIFISYSNAQNNKRLENINSIFDKMEQQGVVTKKPLLFGYFFYDRNKSKLENLKNDLMQNNYKLVRLELVEKNEFILHVEKVETHSRASLLERENELENLSKKYNIEKYDGWDVGNADPTKPLPLVPKSDFEKSLDNKTDTELYKIANEFYDNENNDKAIIAFKKCIEKNIKTDTSNYKLGVSYLGVGQVENGITNLMKAVMLNPNYFKACFNLGATFYDNHKYQNSIDYYQRALKINSNDDKVFYGIAASQYVIGQVRDAELNCNKALKLNPNNENAISLLDNIKQKK